MFTKKRNKVKLAKNYKDFLKSFHFTVHTKTNFRASDV